MWSLSTAVEVVPGEDEGAYLLDVESGELYSVNEVGAEVVRYLSSERTEAEIAEELARTFGVDERVAIEPDVRRFLLELERSGLVGRDRLKGNTL